MNIAPSTAIPLMITVLNQDKVSLSKGFGLLFGCLCLTAISAETAYGFQITLDETTDEFVHGVTYPDEVPPISPDPADLGSFTLFKGIDSAEDLGTTVNILSDSQKPSGGLDSNSISIDKIIDPLITDGINSTNALVFTFDINETGTVGTDGVDISSLILTFTFPSRSNEIFTLDSSVDDSVTVTNFSSGGSFVESRFQVDFGYDFIAEYDGFDASLYNLRIDSTLTNQNNGPEIYAFSTGLTSTAMPIPFEFSPTLGILFSLGLLGGYHFRKQIKNKLSITLISIVKILG